MNHQHNPLDMSAPEHAAYAGIIGFFVDLLTSSNTWRSVCVALLCSSAVALARYMVKRLGR